MEFSCYFPSVTFVVLTVDQFVERDDGLLEQQKQVPTFVEEIAHFLKDYVKYMGVFSPFFASG